MQETGWTLRSAVIWERPGNLGEPTAHDRPHRTYEHVFIFSKSVKYFFNRDALKGEEDILVERHFLGAPIVELRRPRAGMACCLPPFSRKRTQSRRFCGYRHDGPMPALGSVSGAKGGDSRGVATGTTDSRTFRGEFMIPVSRSVGIGAVARHANPKARLNVDPVFVA